jgi:hypothetical protein
MMYKKNLVIIIILTILIASAGCEINDIPRFFIWSGSETAGASVDEIKKAMHQQGIEFVSEVTYDGHTGILGRYTGLKRRSINPKYCLVLTGTPFSMGYQAGTLMPHDAHEMLTAFIKQAGLAQLEMFGITLKAGDPVTEALWLWMREMITIIVQDAEPKVPAYIRAEMRGLIAGLKAAGYTDVEYIDALILNQGVDSFYYLLAALLGQLPDGSRKNLVVQSLKNLVARNSQLGKYFIFSDTRVSFPKAKPEKWFPAAGCNEFVISADVTADGKTYHGRDFMFSTGKVYQDHCAMMVYLPSDADSRAFATVGAPGFVGHTTGVNQYGLSIGQDVNQSGAFGTDIGMGSLMVVRHILQYASNLKEAVELVQDTPRGVTWDYIIADDETDPDYGPGVVLETLPSDPYYDGPNSLPQWEKTLLLGAILHLTDPTPINGVGIRSAKWVYPSYYSGLNVTLQISNPFYPDLGYWTVGFNFAPQTETDPNVVIATNHFIMPRMRMAQMHPIVGAIYEISGQLGESMWRYDHMEADIRTYHGQIEFFGADPENPAPGTAGWIINFLDIERCDYWSDVENRIEGHRDIIDNSEREIRAVFGYMGEPWVGVKLMPFIDVTSVPTP